jgi:hypothetical protein
MSSNPCGDGEIIESTADYPTKPIKKKPPRAPDKIKICVWATGSDIPRIRPKKNTAAADNPISIPTDKGSIGLNSVIVDLPQGHDMTNPIETSE